jgi:hypothetical protein
MTRVDQAKEIELYNHGQRLKYSSCRFRFGQPDEAGE